MHHKATLGIGKIPTVLKSVIKRTPVYRGIQKARVIHRYRLYRQPRTAAEYLLVDPELSNFTYDIANRDELAMFVAEVSGCDANTAHDYIVELDADQEFSAALAEILASHPHQKRPAMYGRRLGWYAIVRALKPRLVFETGTSNGLGAAVLGRAIQRNGVGRAITFDIKDWTGWLIPEGLPVERVIGDAAVMLPETVARCGSPDLFVHDSDHSYAHELREFESLYKPGMLCLTDNAHATTALADFARSRGLAFTYWRERPLAHWYPGSGIGAAGY